MSWTIKGEAGKTLDATERSLASIGIKQAKLKLTSLDSDTFEWAAITDDAAGTGTIIPDPGQVIEVFYSGTRRFRGNVTIPRVRYGRVEIKAEGAWWWWERIPLTQVQSDEESNTKERANYVFPTQALKTSIEALIDRAIANGVPVIRGSVATMFDFPRITISEKSCAQALADLMSICPDAVAYYDYSGASGTYPTLNIARRGGMSAQTYTLGTDDVEDMDIHPRLDLEVASIKVAYNTRNGTTGKTQYAEQTTGTPAAGKNQIVVVSGPEVNDFLPKDASNSTEIETFAMPTGGIALSTLTTSSSHTSTSVTGDPRTFVTQNDQQIATMIREFGSSFSSYLFLSNGGRYNISLYTTGNLNGAPGINLDRPNLISKDSTSGMYVIMSGGLVPDWLEDENNYTVTDATFTGYMRYTRNGLTSDPSWWDEAVRRAEQVLVGYQANVSGQTTGQYQYNAFFPVSIPCKLINASFSTLTTVYRAWAYDYISPPAGMLAGLLGAQNWIPYDGTIKLESESVDGANSLDKKYNISGGYAPLAAMNALAKMITYEIDQGRKIISLGAPARTDFGTLAARFRRHPKDNITYI